MSWCSYTEVRATMLGTLVERAWATETSSQTDMAVT